MSTLIPTSPAWRRGARACRGDEWPCVVCGQPVSPAGWWIRVHEGGSHAVTPAEAAALNAAGHEGADMGWLRIGARCLRQNPALAPYASREPTA